MVLNLFCYSGGGDGSWTRVQTGISNKEPQFLSRLLLSYSMTWTKIAIADPSLCHIA